MAGFFDGENLDDGGVAGGRIYFDAPHSYIVEVVECKGGIGVKDKMKYFAIRAKILKSTNPNKRPGIIATQVIKFRPATPYMANIKDFIATAFGVTTKEVDPASLEMVISPEQPIKGRVFNLVVTTSQTRYCPHQWTLFEGSVDEINALKKAVALGEVG